MLFIIFTMGQIIVVYFNWIAKQSTFTSYSSEHIVSSMMHLFLEGTSALGLVTTLKNLELNFTQ